MALKIASPASEWLKTSESHGAGGECGAETENENPRPQPHCNKDAALRHRLETEGREIATIGNFGHETMRTARTGARWLIRVGVATAMLTAVGVWADAGMGGTAMARPAVDGLGPVVPALEPPPGMIAAEPTPPPAIAPSSEAVSATQVVLFFVAVWFVASLRVRRVRGRWKLGFDPAATRRAASKSPASRRQSFAGGNGNY